MNATTNRTVSPEEVLALAKVRKIKGFYTHVIQYIIVISVMTVINYIVTPRHLWAIWAALGWGSGLLIHGLRAFDKIPFLNGEWERRQVERRLGRKL